MPREDLEPQLTESESVVLPLDDGATVERGEIGRGFHAVNAASGPPLPRRWSGCARPRAQAPDGSAMAETEQNISE